MKKILLLSAILGISVFAHAQESLKDKLKRKLEEAKERKIDQTIDKALNKSEEKLDKTVNGVIEGEGKEKKEKTSQTETNGINEQSANSQVRNSSTSFTAITANSKFDFISGEKILYYDDFSRVNIGDFPAEMNTNSSGEVVNLTGKDGKWLNLTKNGVFIPENIKALDDNFTLEFEAGITSDPSNNYTGLGLIFKTDPNQLFQNFTNGSFIYLHPAADKGYFTIAKEGADAINNEANMFGWNFTDKQFAKISVWRQKGRIRVYVNESKIFDLPRFFAEDKPYYFAFDKNFWAECGLFITNIKYAIGAPDTRSKLITEGKLVTRGILFDSNSDKIKPESNGVLKDIATVLTENPTVKVKIVGHTDSDGDANLNLDLSKRRAEAVKNSLVSVFNIDASRLSTEGKGASQPTDPNTTLQGKANNRRVEFIKL